MLVPQAWDHPWTAAGLEVRCCLVCLLLAPSPTFQAGVGPAAVPHGTDFIIGMPSLCVTLRGVEADMGTGPRFLPGPPERVGLRSAEAVSGATGAAPGLVLISSDHHI